MNIPMSWLREFTEVPDTKEYMDKITESGTKVECLTVLGKDITNVRVGKVLSIEKHPDADKLVITKIDIGEKTLQIVTGATNLYEGAFVPVALDGATLANGVKIKTGKLRGQVSEGMLCSIDELGYTRTDYPEAPEHGIYIFQNEQPLGADVVPILELYDEVVEYEITSNRPDCYSVFGIAREAAATFDKYLQSPRFAKIEQPNNEHNINVTIENTKLSSRYIAFVVENVKIEPSPQWLRHRLTACGIRPVNNIVDITNYICLELGQPMHAFSIENIDMEGDKRAIYVRNAKEGERFVTLDGVERVLDSEMTVIADCNKALAIAGIMGGENSMIREDSTTVLFESANFEGTNIRLSSKRLGLRTESSSKFEKGLDPNLAMQAIERAIALVMELKCGTPTHTLVDCYPVPRTERVVPFSLSRINALLGTKISDADCIDYLARLQLKATINGDNGECTIPTFRPDLEMEADLAEEVARIYGYNNIEPTMVTGTPTIGKKTNIQIAEDSVKEIMKAFGFCEILTYAFESPKVFEKLNIPENSSLRKAIKIINPLGDDYSLMRTSTLNGVLQSLSTNFNRRNESAYLFELSKVYIPEELPLTKLPKEPKLLTVGLYGDNADFYYIKGVIEQLFIRFGLDLSFSRANSADLPYMHPGRTANFSVGSRIVGYLGELHPRVAGNYEIETKVYVACVELDVLFEEMITNRTYTPLPKFPGVTRDLAILVEDSVLAADIAQAISKNAKLLTGIKLFDVYKGKQIDEGYKSMAYSLTFRAADRTLTDDEINKEMDKILKSLKEIGSKIRE